MLKLVDYIVQIIVSFLYKAWYNFKTNKLKQEIQEAKKQANEQRRKVDEAKKESDAAYDDFKFKLRQYREHTDGNLRRTVNRVRGSSREAAEDNKESGSTGKDSADDNS